MPLIIKPPHTHTHTDDIKEEENEKVKEWEWMKKERVNFVAFVAFAESCEQKLKIGAHKFSKQI